MPANAATWNIGVARRRITPPLGCQMAGFDARKGVASAVHDDLHARALVFDDGATTVAFVSVEVIAVSAEFSAVVRALVEVATGIPAANVFLCATHTHCGPVTMHHFFNQGQPLDEDYLATLRDAIVAAVRAAAEDRKPRALRAGMVPCEGIAVNRRTTDGLPVDPYAGVLLVEELDGAPAAIAVMYACHTTVLGPDTLSITQDFPFYALAKLKSVLGSETEALFFNGAEGDLSIGHKSDLSAVGIIDSFRTFETAERLGEKLADSVIDGLSLLAYEEPVIDIASNFVALPLKTYGPLSSMILAREKALREIDSEDCSPEMLLKRQRALFARIEEYYASLYEASEATEPKTLAVEISAILLGGTVFLTLPGEIFIQVALAMRAASPFARTLFLGLTNNYIGYLPDELSSAISGYEVIASRVPASAGRLLQDEAQVMLRQMKTRSALREASKA
jgi:neutral ceramidase